MKCCLSLGQLEIVSGKARPDGPLVCYRVKFVARLTRRSTRVIFPLDNNLYLVFSHLAVHRYARHFDVNRDPTLSVVWQRNRAGQLVRQYLW